MKKFMIALVACFLLGAFSNPAPSYTAFQDENKRVAKVATQETENAELVVEGPTTLEAGDLVVISVEKSRAASFKWIVLPETDNFLVIDDGRRAVLSSGNDGVTEFQLFISCSLGDTCDSAVHTIRVKGAVEPTPSDSLTSKVHLWCDLVDSDTKRDDCLKLAQSFSSVALIMDGGTLTTPTEIIQATYNSNQDALGDKLENWKPFSAALAEELTRMSNQGKLPDAQAHVQVWRTIATALRDYADTL